MTRWLAPDGHGLRVPIRRAQRGVRVFRNALMVVEKMGFFDVGALLLVHVSSNFMPESTGPEAVVDWP
ncbi:hypothetical protein [Micromonospora sp. RP3T]|uniref:hypothetical protein n=1 Tax=Micromonospora sp. RP3T TaxID=2135446 RepID=UPI003D7515F4